MPSVIPEILNEVIQSLNCFEDGDLTSKYIERFMLSGRQPFQIGFDYFLMANIIYFKPKFFEIFIKGKRWRFSYDCLLLKFILRNAKISQIVIEFGGQENLFFDNIIKEGLEEVHILCDINGRYLDRMHTISTLKIISIKNSKIRLKDISLIRPCGTDLQIDIDFHNFAAENTIQNLPSIQNITTRGRFLVSDVTPDSLTQFTRNLILSFPNLRTCSIHFTDVNSSWKSIYDVMETLPSDIFGDNVATNSSGEIQFVFSEWNILLSKIIDEIPESLVVQKNGSSLKREIPIKDGLKFVFLLHFRRSEFYKKRFK